MSSGRRTLVAVGIALALGLAYWGWVKQLQPRRDKAKEDAKLIFPGTDAASLKSILLRKKGALDVRLVKGEGQWRLVAPIQAPADNAAVEALVSQLADAKREEVVVEKDADLRDFALDQPSGGVTFEPTSPGAKPQVLFFGMDAPAGAQAYAMLDGRSEVFLTGLGVKSSALKDAGDLRDKSPWSFDPNLVSALRVGAMALSKGKDGSWTVTQAGVAEPGRNAAVQAWLQQLGGLKALSVPSEDGKGRFGLGAGPRLELSFGDSARLTLVKGGAAKPSGFYAQVLGQKPVFILPAASEAQFKKSAGDLADRDAFQVLPEQVDRFELSGPAGPLRATKKLGVWGWDGRATAADEKPFDFAGFVGRFAGAQLLKRLPASQRPAKPAASVTFFSQAGTVLEKAEFGGRSGQGQLVYSNAKRAACVAASNLLEGLPPAQARATSSTATAAVKQP